MTLQAPPLLVLVCSECGRWMNDLYGHIEGVLVGKCANCCVKRVTVPREQAKDVGIDKNNKPV